MPAEAAIYPGPALLSGLTVPRSFCVTIAEGQGSEYGF